MSPARIGLIVPSSNVTVETEIPRILARADSTQFSFHSSRMRMHAVTRDQLLAMNAQRERCVLEIGDASIDALLYACLVAIMATGPGAHRDVELRIAEQLASGGSQAKVLSSAGALVTALSDLRARRVALVMPYMKPLARSVVEYLEGEGFEVPAWRALEVEDNAEVGGIPADAERFAALFPHQDVSRTRIPGQHFGAPLRDGMTSGATLAGNEMSHWMGERFPTAAFVSA